MIRNVKWGEVFQVAHTKDDARRRIGYAFIVLIWVERSE